MYYTYTTNGTSNGNYVKLTYPLLTRLLEYARENSPSDVDLHEILEEIMEHSGKVLSMEHYQELIPEKPAEPQSVTAVTP